MNDAIRRAGTYDLTVAPPQSPSEYSEIVLTFVQNQQIVLQKKTGDPHVSTDEVKVIVTLTQEETKLFQPSLGSPMGRQLGSKVTIQCRCYKSATDAPASGFCVVDVQDAQNEEVLPNV